MVILYDMSETPAFDKLSILRLAFVGLADDELREMAELTKLCTYPVDHILCHEGVYEEVFYIIAEGNVRITKKISENEERVFRISGKGDVVGEMSLIQNAPRSATVKTSTECTVLEMEKKDFETMLSRSPRMALDIMRTTLSRMRENDQQAIAELQKANKVLSQLDRNKLEFIQVAAHELRTPLTVLKGYVSVLNSLTAIKDNSSLNDVVSGITKGADRMHEVVNMMLDVTRIDNETMKVLPTLLPLKPIILDLIKGFTSAIDERKINITIEQSVDTPLINADPSLIQKALHNLLVNAIKYTPDGGSVAIDIHPAVLENNSPAIEINFKDSGIGLDTEHHELIFEKFYQVGDVAIHSSGKTSFKGGGAGLGLAIVRGIARAHGGKVWVESIGHDETNLHGSIFHLLLPVDPQSPRPVTK